MNTETKTLTFSVKAVGTRTDAETGQEFGQIEALGAVFDNVDEDRDRIRPGAFTRTIKNSKERAGARGKKYLAPMLWQHDTHELIGGWYDLSETPDGLLGKGDISLATQRGREYYALAKAGMADQFSIIYDIPAGGATYTKSGVRDLTELRLFSLDPVTFAANDATALVAVKAAAGGGDGTMNTKAASDEDKQAQEARSKKYGIAVKDGGNVTKPSADSDVPDSQWGDPVNYRYPMKDKAHADNAAARFTAATAREQYTAAEQDTIAKRIMSRQRDFDEEPDWWPIKDDSKTRRTRMLKKTFAEHYQEEQCEDLLEDWCDVVLCAFTAAVYDAFAIGDQPEADVNDALDGLKTAVAEWVAEAVKYNLSDYLDDQDLDYNPGLSRMQNGSATRYGYGYFSRPDGTLARKAMMAGDATTGGFTADHVEKMRGAASKAMKAVEKHAAALHDAAAEVKDLVGPTTSGEKAGRAFSAANAKALTDHADALDDAADAIQRQTSRHMKAITSVADDLETVLQGSEAAYGTDPGNAGDHQEGKQRSARAQTRTPSGGSLRLARTPLLRTAPPASTKSADTPAEDDVNAALATLRKLRTVPVSA